MPETTYVACPACGCTTPEPDPNDTDPMCGHPDCLHCNGCPMCWHFPIKPAPEPMAASQLAALDGSA